MIDFTSTTYDYRWQRFYDALKKAHPNVNYVASAHLDGVHLPAVDVHDFSGPEFFYDAFTRCAANLLGMVEYFSCVV